MEFNDGQIYAGEKIARVLEAGDDVIWGQLVD